MEVYEKYNKSEKKIKIKRISVIAVAMLTSFIATFMGSALSLSVPAIEKELETGAQTVSWVITAYMLACAFFAVPCGIYADSGKRKRVLCIGIALFCAACIAAAMAKKISMLIGIRALQGCGAAMIFSTNLAVLTAQTDERKKGRMLGYAACANYLGLSAGPVLGGILNDAFGWRFVFLCMAIAAGIALAIALLGIGKDPAEETVQACENPVKHRKKENKDTVSARIRGLFANRPFVFSNIAALINYGANFSVTYLMSLYLQVVRSYTSSHAGLIMLCQTVVMVAAAPLIGRLSDRRSPHLISAVGMLICGAALALFIFLQSDTPLTLILLMLAAAGTGASVFSAANTAAVMKSVDENDYAAASSILSSMRSAGHACCMGIVTVTVGIFLGDISLKDADPQSMQNSMHAVFFIYLVLCILGFFMARKEKM